MAAKKRGLGRGLDALLGATVAGIQHDESPDTVATQEPGTVLRTLPVERLVKGSYQPRKAISQDSLQELADSIRAQGLVQPVVVRPVDGGRYELIAGERRWRAAQLAGLTEVPALVREVSDQVALAIALIENIQREDLNPLEEAQALKRLCQEFGMTHQQVAEAVGRSRAAVSNLLRLLELDAEVQRLLREQRLEMGHARALLSLPPNLQREAARQVMIRGLSVRETEELVRQLQREPPAQAPKKEEAEQDPNIRSLQNELSARLGANVSIQHSPVGKGRLVIQYHSLDELDGIIDHIK